LIRLEKQDEPIVEILQNARQVLRAVIHELSGPHPDCVASSRMLAGVDDRLVHVLGLLIYNP
jgi:hypothetical protein